MQEVLVFATVISPIILALVEVLKRSFTTIPATYVPLVSIVVGLLVGYASVPFTDLDLVLRLWAGGLAGLSATGLFELVRPSKGGEK